MSRLIACRIGSYGKFQDDAWTHLPQIGIRHVEIMAPEPGDLEAMRAQLKDHGLQASSLQGRCDITLPDAAETLEPQLAACDALGARILFLSVKAGETPLEMVYHRLSQAGERAQAHGVTIALETHPDLVTNMDVAMQTMQGVDQPGVRINFDTANIHYYNEHVSETAELAKAINYVAAVHLKDTAGGHHDFNFPALGQGKVDFPGVFQQLDAAGFTGPYPMELEGEKGVEYTRETRLQYVADSVAYLKQHGWL